MTATPKVLYRRGSLISPSMERIRWVPQPPHHIKDVVVFITRPGGVLWVKMRSGGVSTNEIPPSITPRQKIWTVQAGIQLPSELSLHEEHPGNGHWFWEPAHDMPFLVYEAALLRVNGFFT